MLGVRKMNVAGASRGGVAQIVQGPLHAPEPIGSMATARTGPLPVVATSPDDLRLGQVFNGRDTFAGIGNIFTWFWHGDGLLREQLSPEPSPSQC